MLTISDAAATAVEIPLRHAFATAQDQFARQASRLVRLTLTLSDGRHAVGECVPVRYVTGETQETALDALRISASAMVGMRADRPIAGISAVDRALSERLGLRDPSLDMPSARAAVEMALHDALCIQSGLPAWSLFGGAVAEVETDVTLALTPDTKQRAAEMAAEGFRRFKVKLGRADTGDDLRTLTDVLEAVPDAAFRLDANQAFTADEALRFVEQAMRSGARIECLEQPVAKEDLRALDTVARRSPVPVFADEAVRTPAQALQVVSETQVHGINVKLMKSGIGGARDIAAIARAAGRKLMVGCMLETRRGIGWALAVAAGCGAFELYDLDSHMLLVENRARMPERESVWSSVGFSQSGPILTISR